MVREDGRMANVDRNHRRLHRRVKHHLRRMSCGTNDEYQSVGEYPKRTLYRRQLTIAHDIEFSNGRSIAHADPSAHEHELFDGIQQIGVRSHEQRDVCHRTRRHHRDFVSRSPRPGGLDVVHHAFQGADCVAIGVGREQREHLWAVSFGEAFHAA